MTESRFQANVLTYLRDELKIYANKQYPFKKGTPDVGGFIPHRSGNNYFALELKVDARTQEIQKLHLQNIRNLGGYAGIFRWSKDWKLRLKELMETPELINELPLK